MASHYVRRVKDDKSAQDREGEQRKTTHNGRHSTHDRRLQLSDVSSALSDVGVSECLDLSVSDGHSDKDPGGLNDNLEDVCEREEGEVEVRVVENLVKKSRDGSD